MAGHLGRRPPLTGPVGPPEFGPAGLLPGDPPWYRDGIVDRAPRPEAATGPADEHGTVLHLPSPLASLRHSVPALVEGVFGPFALFYAVLLLAGFRGALLAALGWTYLAVARRLWRRERPAATVLLGMLLLSVRTAVAFATGSAFLYFAQPTLGTALVAVVFVASALLGRPLIERLARDFCPLDPSVMARPAVRRFFVRVSLLWGSVLLVNAGFVMWLLVTSSLHAFVVERTAVSWALTCGAVALSTVWFVRTMRRNGITVRWGQRHPAAVAGGAAT